MEVCNWENSPSGGGPWLGKSAILNDWLRAINSASEITKPLTG